MLIRDAEFARIIERPDEQIEHYPMLVEGKLAEHAGILINHVKKSRPDVFEGMDLPAFENLQEYPSTAKGAQRILVCGLVCGNLSKIVQTMLKCVKCAKRKVL
ncbi:MAG: hypothetical protein ABSF52_04620 [Syntrophobacteraceae bacterium]